MSDTARRSVETVRQSTFTEPVGRARVNSVVGTESALVELGLGLEADVWAT
jgi:hypothetical protein